MNRITLLLFLPKDLKLLTGNKRPDQKLGMAGSAEDVLTYVLRSIHHFDVIRLRSRLVTRPQAFYVLNAAFVKLRI